MEKQRKGTGWLLIALLALLSGVALGANSFAAARLDENLQRHVAVIDGLFPALGGRTDGLVPLSVSAGGFVYAIRADNRELGYAAQTTVTGYRGPIEVTVGYTPARTLAGVHVGGESFRETEELGAKVRLPGFTSQFQGKTAPLRLGADVEAVSGATVSSQAVVDAVNRCTDMLAAAIGPAALPTASDP